MVVGSRVTAFLSFGQKYWDILRCEIKRMQQSISFLTSIDLETQLSFGWRTEPFGVFLRGFNAVLSTLLEVEFLGFFFCCLFILAFCPRFWLRPCDRISVCCVVDFDFKLPALKQCFRYKELVAISRGMLREEQFFVGLLSQDEQSARPCDLQISFWHYRTIHNVTFRTMFLSNALFSFLVFYCSFNSRSLQLNHIVIEA